MFIDGASDKNSGNEVVLGSAYWNTSFVIYQKTVQSLSDSPAEPNRALLESIVINHELGHLLGLTNLMGRGYDNQIKMTDVIFALPYISRFVNYNKTFNSSIKMSMEILRSLKPSTMRLFSSNKLPLFKFH